MLALTKVGAKSPVGGKTVHHHGGRAEQEIEPLAGALAGVLGLLAFGDVGPRADDLDGLALASRTTCCWSFTQK